MDYKEILITKKEEAIKKIVFLAITFFILSVPGLAISDSSSDPGSWTGNINVFLGAKALDEDDWEPAESQVEGGILLDFKKNNWPVSIAIDFLASSYDTRAIGTFSGGIEAKTREVNLGIRKIWDQFPKMRPFIGGGIAFIWAEFEETAPGVSVSDNDIGAGVWIGGGIYWTITEDFNIGLDLRWSKAEVTLFDSNVDAGGGHAGLLLGFHW